MAAPISTTYTAEERERIVGHVLAELSGGRAVSRILREDEEMPDVATFWRWHFEDEGLREKVAHARENGVEALMDETISIADDSTRDWRKSKDDEDEREFAPDHVQRAKLRVDTRHKYAQMIAPRKYGTKVDLTTGGQPLNVQLVRFADDPHPE
jgi:hypothetical protein